MPERKKGDFEALFKRIFRRKITSAKMEKSADKSLSQPSCSQSNTIYEVQLQKTIVLRMQPQHEATLTQPLQCELQNTIELRATALEIVAPEPDFDARAKKKTILKHFLKGFLEGKSLAPKWRKKRISCETSFKTPSATHPPAPLAIPFTLRERSYSCKSQWNSVDRTCTKNT